MASAYALVQQDRFSDAVVFYQAACLKGAAGGCTIAAISSRRNSATQIKWYAKGCELSHERSSCLPALMGYVEIKKFALAKPLFKDYCDSDQDLECYMQAAAFPKPYKPFIQSLCKDDHQSTACNISAQMNWK